LEAAENKKAYGYQVLVRETSATNGKTIFVTDTKATIPLKIISFFATSRC
jgi:hypothetical protein